MTPLTESLTASFAGLSHEFLSLKAKAQARDKHGRFIKMNSIVRWKDTDIDGPGGGSYHWGSVKGIDHTGHIHVLEEHSSHKGEVSLLPKQVEVVKALIPHNAADVKAYEPNKPVSHVNNVLPHLNNAGIPNDKIHADTHLTPIAAHEDTKDPWGEPLYVDTAGFKKVGGQGGSNPGGIFEGPDGTQYYIKKAQDEQHVANEILAARLYQDAGIKVPDVYATEWTDGSPAVASKMIPGMSPLFPHGQTNAETLAQGRKGFSMDAWLANWDSVGLEYDNMMKDSKGNAVRVDTGGALLYRAMGSPKGAAFGDKVTEVTTLRDKNKNGQAAKIFGGMSDAALKQDIQNTVDKVDTNKLNALIDELPFDNQKVKDDLKKTLQARKDDLHSQFGITAPEKPTEPTPTVAANAPQVDQPSVTADQKYALNVYTGSGYGTINKHLRGTGTSEDKSIFEVQYGKIDDVVAQLDSTVASGTLTHDTVLYRGSDTSAVPDGTHEGSVLSDAGFLSTTSSLGSARAHAKKKFAKPEDQVIFEIHAPAGTHAFDLDKSGVGEGEKEFLLPRGTSFKVTKISVDENGVKHVEANLLAEGPPTNLSGPHGQHAIDLAKTPVQLDKGKVDDFLKNGPQTPAAPKLTKEEISAKFGQQSGDKNLDGTTVQLAISLKKGDLIKVNGAHIVQVDEPYSGTKGVTGTYLDGNLKGGKFSQKAHKSAKFSVVDPNSAEGKKALGSSDGAATVFAKDVKAGDEFLSPGGTHFKALEDYSITDKGIKAQNVETGKTLTVKATSLVPLKKVKSSNAPETPQAATPEPPVAAPPVEDHLSEIAAGSLIKGDLVQLSDGTIAQLQEDKGYITALKGLTGPRAGEEIGAKWHSSDPLKKVDPTSTQGKAALAKAQPLQHYEDGPFQPPVMNQAKLNEKQHDALNEYTGDGYVPINNYLRGKGSDEYSYWSKEALDTAISRIDSAIDSATLPHDATIYRGVSKNTLPNPTPGQIITDTAYMSTSSNIKIAKGFSKGVSGSIIEIHIPAGAHALDADKAGMWNGEKEFILPRNTQLLIKEVGVQSDGRKYVIADLLLKGPHGDAAKQGKEGLGNDSGGAPGGVPTPNDVGTGGHPGDGTGTGEGTGAPDQVGDFWVGDKVKANSGWTGTIVKHNPKTGQYLVQSSTGPSYWKKPDQLTKTEVVTPEQPNPQINATHADKVNAAIVALGKTLPQGGNEVPEHIDGTLSDMVNHPESVSQNDVQDTADWFDTYQSGLSKAQSDKVWAAWKNVQNAYYGGDAGAPNSPHDPATDEPPATGYEMAAAHLVSVLEDNGIGFEDHNLNPSSSPDQLKSWLAGYTSEVNEGTIPQLPNEKAAAQALANELGVELPTDNKAVSESAEFVKANNLAVGDIIHWNGKDQKLLTHTVVGEESLALLSPTDGSSTTLASFSNDTNVPITVKGPASKIEEPAAAGVPDTGPVPVSALKAGDKVTFGNNKTKVWTVVSAAPVSGSANGWQVHLVDDKGLKTSMSHSSGSHVFSKVAGDTAPTDDGKIPASSLKVGDSFKEWDGKTYTVTKIYTAKDGKTFIDGVGADGVPSKHEYGFNAQVDKPDAPPAEHAPGELIPGKDLSVGQKVIVTISGHPATITKIEPFGPNAKQIFFNYGNGSPDTSLYVKPDSTMFKVPDAPSEPAAPGKVTLGNDLSIGQTVKISDLKPGDHVSGNGGKDHYVINSVTPGTGNYATVNYTDKADGHIFNDQFPKDGEAFAKEGESTPAAQSDNTISGPDLKKGDTFVYEGETYTVTDPYTSADGNTYIDAENTKGNYKYISLKPGETVTKPGTESHQTPPEPAAPSAPNGTLVPGSDHVYKDAKGEYVVTKNGHTLRVGDKVTSTKDGHTGTIVQLEKGPHYIKVKGEDGKIKGRQMDTLVPAKTAEPAPPAPKVSAAPETPSNHVKVKGSDLKAGDTLISNVGQPIGVLSNPTPEAGGSTKWSVTLPSGSHVNTWTTDHSSYTAIKAPKKNYTPEQQYEKGIITHAEYEADTGHPYKENAPSAPAIQVGDHLTTKHGDKVTVTSVSKTPDGWQHIKYDKAGGGKGVQAVPPTGSDFFTKTEEAGQFIKKPVSDWKVGDKVQYTTGVYTINNIEKTPGGSFKLDLVYDETGVESHPVYTPDVTLPVLSGPQSAVPAAKQFKLGDPIMPKDVVPGMTVGLKYNDNQYKVDAVKTLLNGKISLDLKNADDGEKFPGHTLHPDMEGWVVKGLPDSAAAPAEKTDLYEGLQPGEVVPVSKMVPGMLLKGKMTGNLYEVVEKPGEPNLAGNTPVSLKNVNNGEVYVKTLKPSHGYLVPSPEEQAHAPSTSTTPEEVHGSKLKPGDVFTSNGQSYTVVSKDNGLSAITAKNAAGTENVFPQGLKYSKISSAPSTPTPEAQSSQLKVGDTVKSSDFKDGMVVKSGTNNYKISNVKPYSNGIQADFTGVDSGYVYKGIIVSKNETAYKLAEPVDAPTAPAAPATPAAPSGTLVPGSEHVYKDALGKYVINKHGYVLREGMQVVSTKDGHAGTIKLLELKAKYAKVTGADGSTKGRQIDTLKPTDANAQKVTPGTAHGAPTGVKPTSLNIGDKVTYTSPTTGESMPGKVVQSEPSYGQPNSHFILFKPDDGTGEKWTHTGNNDTSVFSKTGASPQVDHPVAGQTTDSGSSINKPGGLVPEVAAKGWIQNGTTTPKQFKPGDVVGHNKQLVVSATPHPTNEKKTLVQFADQAAPLVLHNTTHWEKWDPTLPGVIAKKNASQFSPGDIVGTNENDVKVVKQLSEWGDTPGNVEVLFKGDPEWHSIPEDASYYQFAPGTTPSPPSKPESPAGPVKLTHDPIDHTFPEGGTVSVPAGGSVYAPQYWTKSKPIMLDAFGHSFLVDPKTGETTPSGSASYHLSLLKSGDLLTENTNQADVTPNLDAALGDQKQALIAELEKGIADSPSWGYGTNYKALLKLINDPSGDSLTQQDWEYAGNNLLYGLGSKLSDIQRAAVTTEIAKLQKKHTGTYAGEWRGSYPATQYWFDGNQRKALGALGLSKATQDFVTTKSIAPASNKEAAAEIHAAVTDPTNSQVIDDLFGHGTAADIAKSVRGNQFKAGLSGNSSPYATKPPDLPSAEGKNATVFLGDNVVAADGQGGVVVLVTPEGKLRVRRSDGTHFTRKADSFTVTGSPVTSNKPQPTVAFSAKPRPEFQLADWTKPPVAGISTIPDALSKIKESEKAGNVGWSFAADGGQVEDLNVHVSRVLDAQGQELIELKFKLTPKQGDLMFKRNSADSENWSDKTIQIDGRQLTSADKLAQLTGSHSYSGHGGRTFTKNAAGVQIQFHRANNKTMSQSGSNPVAFHNMVQIRMPANSSVADIQKAMYDAGVDKPAPSTSEDFMRLGNSRLIALFGGKTNAWIGNDNLSASSKATLLENIKSQWGIEAKDLGVAHGANGRIELRLPQEVVDKIRAETKVNYTAHALTGGYDSLANIGKSPHGALLSTTMRRTEGVQASGMSSTADIHSGGADYLFAYPRQTLAPLNGLVFDTSRLFQRMDFFTRAGDTFGTHGPNMDIISETKPTAHEIMFKHRLDLDDAIGFIVGSEAQRKEQISELKKAGVTHFGSRTVEQFIITNPGGNATAPTPQVPITWLKDIPGGAA